MTGPSASGSENGTPSSTRSAPDSAYASAMAREVSRSGKPPIMYGIRAALPSLRATSKACLIRPTPAATISVIKFFEPRDRLGQVFVPAPAQANQVKTRGIVSSRVRQKPCDDVRGLEGGQDSLQPRQLPKRAKGLGVGDRLVAGAAGIAKLGVLGAHPRIVEPGGDGVRLQDLPLGVRQYRRHRTVQDTRTTGDQRRAVMSVESLSPGLDADQLDIGVVDERIEGPDRVRAAAHAGDDPRGELALRRQRLLSRLVTDHPLQVAHEPRVGRRPQAGADDLVGRPDVGHPVADRCAHRLLQRAGARLHRAHLGVEQAHPLDVRRLPPHVLGTHVDDAFEAQQRAGGGSRHAVLPSARLGDDPLLAHPAGEERLSDRVVDLVSARVRQVLALQIYAPAHSLGQPRSEIERRGASHVVAQQRVELAAEPGVVAGPGPGRRELVERGDQHLGDVATAVGTEALLDRRSAHAGTACARSANAPISAWSLMPGSASTPLATSTANGWVTAIASSTLSGVSPPARIRGTSDRRSAKSSQSKLAPVPPCAPGRCASSRWKSVRYASAACTSAALRTRIALITLQRVRRATSWQNAAPSPPCSWSMVRDSSSAAAASSSSVAFTNTPTTSSRRLSAAEISTAASGSHRRGLPGQWFSPIAHAPRRSASIASSRFVMPQNLTRIGSRVRPLSRA